MKLSPTLYPIALMFAPAYTVFFTVALDPVVMFTRISVEDWIRYPDGSQLSVGSGVCTSTVPCVVPLAATVRVVVTDPAYP